MPNYSLLINSEFKPYSFDELVKPFQMYAQAYNEVDSAYNTLGTNAGALESVLNQERDKAAWGQYNAYMQGLNDAATELATKGLSPAARTQVGNLTKQYAQNIVPIQKAAETWQKQIEEQRKTGYNMINSYDASKLSIDQFLENPQLTYQTIDRYKLADQSAKLYSNMAKDLREATITKTDSKGNKIPYYIWYKEKYGVTPDEAQEFMAVMQTAIDSGNKDLLPYAMSVNPKLGNVFNTIFQSTPAVNWTDQEAKADVMGTILQGVMSAVGTEHYKPMEDKAAVLAAQRKNQEQSTGIPINKRPLRNQKSLSEEAKEINKYIDKGYLVRNADGSIEVTQKGLDNMFSKTSIPYGRTWLRGPARALAAGVSSMMAMSGNKEGAVDFMNTASNIINEKTGQRHLQQFTQFGEFMKDKTGYTGLFNPSTGETVHIYNEDNRYANALNNYYNSIKDGGYDTFQSTEYVINVPSSNQKEYASQVISSLPISDGKRQVTPYDITYKDNSPALTPDGKAADIEDDGSWRATQTYPSKYGTRVRLVNDKGEEIITRVPTDVNYAILSGPSENGIGTMPSLFMNKEDFETILAYGKQPIVDKDGAIIGFSDKPLTDDERKRYLRALNTIEQQIMITGSQIGTDYSTPTVQVKPGQTVSYE